MALTDTLSARSRATASEIRLERVSKRFGEVAAVDTASLSIRPGELVTLLGPSGCGKTTTLRLIAGLELPSEGRIVIDGRDVTLLSASERNIAMVFQSYALFPHMTVAENVAYGLTVSGMGRRPAAERAREALAQVGLTGFDRRLPSELSGGQQQRVAVARALVLEPGVLLFDEPLSNLDAKLRRQVRQDIRDLQQRLGITTVYVTHDQEEALAVSDRLVVMDRGRVAQVGSPQQLYRRPADAFVATFIGDTLVAEGEVAAISGETATVRLADARLRLPSEGLVPGPIHLALRPEALRIVSSDSDLPRLRGTVRSRSYLGRATELLVETAIGMLLVQHDPEAEVAVGSEITLGLIERRIGIVGGG